MTCVLEQPFVVFYVRFAICLSKLLVLSRSSFFISTWWMELCLSLHFWHRIYDFYAMLGSSLLQRPEVMLCMAAE